MRPISRTISVEPTEYLGTRGNSPTSIVGRSFSAMAPVGFELLDAILKEIELLVATEEQTINRDQINYMPF